ncbi:hypothetical protein F5Y16DRAFT_385953 [Xylariaceae sp. FL0255]|nr:hypothetical protein F5Y16DRAFT_385953 [Xylariaceae sp. FL0255]
MGSWTAFLLTYLLGGLTFLPLLVIIILLHAHLTFPVRDDASLPSATDPADNIVQPGDDTTHLETAQKDQKNEIKQKIIADSDVAAGYFAVCREYTPMGINAKPIERSTPVGSTTVAAPSPSVYQSMYRSIFDRKQTPGPLDDNKNASQRPKRAGNVFYLVLRHGHLMLFDDEEQLEVRHVVSLANHSVSLHSGGDRTPEGELFIKRNAICLARRTDAKEMTPDTQISKPFYLFSENCSAKEDFYHALLRNQEQTFAAQTNVPKPRRFEVKHIISLVQKLHSSDDQLQTRWFNAFLGRIFLAIYKTEDIENLIKEKITKKISRVKRPAFLTRIAIQGLSTGESAPYFSNPRLKDLNVEGECVMEADIKYTGKFRLEVAATARIDLGTRFKAREVNLVLAVVLKKLEGHMLFKIKPPPSNRIWFSFQSMPKIEMTIEPIVSSRQITYTVILRQIENRIKEVIAETLVLPFWDDVPFFNTEHKHWRGGIFEGDNAVVHSEDHATIAAELGHVDEINELEQTSALASPELPPIEKSATEPNVENTQTASFWARKLGKKNSQTLRGSPQNSASTSALDINKHASTPSADIPRPMRSGSFSASSPVVSTEAAHAEVYKPSTTPPAGEDAASTMASISAKSQSQSPIHTPHGSPSKSAGLDTFNQSASSSTDAVHDIDATPKAGARRDTASSLESTSNGNHTSDPPRASSKAPSVASGTGSTSKGFFSRKEQPSPASTHDSTENKRNTLAAVSNAAATAKRWGWNAIQRQAEQNGNGKNSTEPPLDLNQPMGRGQPLPPPGTPLPRPGQKATAVPKRKPVALPPQLTSKKSGDLPQNEQQKVERRPVPPPPLPRRRRVSALHDDELHGHVDAEENLLVVEAPAEEPVSPPGDSTISYEQPWVEEGDEGEGTNESARSESPPDESPMAPELPGRPTHPSQSNEQEKHVNKQNQQQHHDTDADEDYSSWIDNPEFDDEEGEVKSS